MDARRDFAAAINADTNPDSSNKQGARRDAHLIRLALIGPIWIDILVKLGFFTRRQTCQRRMQILEDDHRVRYAGRARTGVGTKKAHMWSLRRIAYQLLQHEVDVMRVFFSFWPHAYALTGQDVDPKFRADMELTIGSPETGRTFLVELDRDTERIEQIRGRLAHFDSCQKMILFIAPSQERIDEVKRLSGNLNIYYSTLDRVVADGWGNHWTNRIGEAARIEKPAS